MMKFTILVIASVLASGHAADLEFGNLPFFFPETRPLPVPVPAPEVLPLPLPELEPVAPEILPIPVPEAEPVVPELGVISPCDSCFEYMTALIDQLTEVAVPESEVARPLPEGILPEIEIEHLPLPIEPEVVARPLPEGVVLPEIETRPLPVPEAVIRPLPLIIDA